jgi:hypothetical protein
MYYIQCKYIYIVQFYKFILMYCIIYATYYYQLKSFSSIDGIL